VNGVVSGYGKIGWRVSGARSGMSWSGNGAVSGDHRNRPFTLRSHALPMDSRIKIELHAA